MTNVFGDGDVGALIGQLDDVGFVIVPGALEPDEVRAARADLMPLIAETPFGANSFVGYKTRRVFGLFAKSRSFDRAATSPMMSHLAEHYLGHHHLSSTVAIEIHPGERAQTLHSDDSAWPVPRSDRQIVLNSMWAVDDFTIANGATAVVPGSHRWPDGRSPAAEPTTSAVMPAGSVLIYLGSLWHGGGANASGTPRLGVIIEYTSSWLRQQENLTLTCPPELARSLPTRLAELLGYALRPPFLGHVDGRDPHELL